MGGASRGWVRGRCLGRGSTATVYLAASTTSAETQRFFAVKSAELSSSAPLTREHQLLSSLCSPHIVSCLGSDVTAEPDGRVLFNLFMEYVPGSDLSEVIKQHGGLHEHTIRVCTRGILDGLAYLHGRGIVHCDVKGHNVLVGKDGGSVKLADLGCARLVDDGNDDLGVVGGTPLYMAPEVARGEAQGPPADVWALGCTVIEMATGFPPWRDVWDPVAAIHRIAFSTDVPEFPCNVSDDARDFLGRCLNRDPRKRWSAEELRNHPFVNGSEEFPMDCVKVSKRHSPNSTLEHGFWDSWQSGDQDEEEGEAGRHLEKQPMEFSCERLRRLIASGVSLQPRDASATWEEGCWITIRNCESLESPSEEDDPPANAGSWWVEPTADAGDGTGESAGYYTDNSIITTEGDPPANPSLPSAPVDVNGVIYPSTVIILGEGNYPVETQNSLDQANRHETVSIDYAHDTCSDLRSSQEIIMMYSSYSYPIVLSCRLLASSILPNFDWVL